MADFMAEGRSWRSLSALSPSLVAPGESVRKQMHKFGMCPGLIGDPVKYIWDVKQGQKLTLSTGNEIGVFKSTF